MSTPRTRVKDLLSQHIDTLSYDIDVIVDSVMDIATERTYLNARDVSRYVRRNDVTVRGWVRRGQYEFPAPAGYMGGGGIPYWDLLDIQVWAQEHPGLLGTEDPTEVDRRYPPV